MLVISNKCACKHKTEFFVTFVTDCVLHAGAVFGKRLSVKCKDVDVKRGTQIGRWLTTSHSRPRLCTVPIKLNQLFMSSTLLEKALFAHCSSLFIILVGTDTSIEFRVHTHALANTLMLLAVRNSKALIVIFQETRSVSHSKCWKLKCWIFLPPAAMEACHSEGLISATTRSSTCTDILTERHSCIFPVIKCGCFGQHRSHQFTFNSWTAQLPSHHSFYREVKNMLGSGPHLYLLRNYKKTCVGGRWHSQRLLWSTVCDLPDEMFCKVGPSAL